jgi:hypothetical protein
MHPLSCIPPPTRRPYLPVRSAMFAVICSMISARPCPISKHHQALKQSHKARRDHAHTKQKQVKRGEGTSVSGHQSKRECVVLSLKLEGRWAVGLKICERNEEAKLQKMPLGIQEGIITIRTISSALSCLSYAGSRESENACWFSHQVRSEQM